MSSNKEPTVNEVVNTECDATVNPWQHMTSEQMMQKVLTEVMGLRSTMDNINTKVDTLQTEQAEWKKQFHLMTTEMSEVKESVEMAHNLINDETKNRQTAVSAIKEDLKERAKESAQNLTLLKMNLMQVKYVSDGLTSLRMKVDLLEEKQKDINKPLEELKTKIEDKLGHIEFPVKNTIVGQNMWYKEDENLEAVASLIINKTLELEDIKIVRVMRKSGWKNGSGLIKIELESSNAVKAVLKNKSKLKQSHAEELRNIYLRQSKKEEVLTMERNEDLIM